MFVVGAAATALATRATYANTRPRDVLFGALAPVAMMVALTGLLLVFVPDFFG